MLVNVSLIFNKSAVFKNVTQICNDNKIDINN